MRMRRRFAVDAGPAAGDGDRAFRACYDAHFDRVYRYVAHRHPDRSDVADVVADVFAVAWRRRTERPAGDAELPWLFGVARRGLPDDRRAASRRDRLVSRIASQPAPSNDHTLTASGADNGRLERAMASLGERDREALRLVTWDDLPGDTPQAGV